MVVFDIRQAMLQVKSILQDPTLLQRTISTALKLQEQTENIQVEGIKTAPFLTVIDGKPVTHSRQSWIPLLPTVGQTENSISNRCRSIIRLNRSLPSVQQIEITSTDITTVLMLAESPILAVLVYVPPIAHWPVLILSHDCIEVLELLRRPRQIAGWVSTLDPKPAKKNK